MVGRALICIALVIWTIEHHTQYEYVPNKEEYVSAHEFEPELMRVTCYLPTGNKTASGVYPSYGMCASNREHLGDVAAVYDINKNFIGYFECTDVGGADRLRKGVSIDIYQDNMANARAWVAEYGDYCYVMFIEAEG